MAIAFGIFAIALAIVSGVQTLNGYSKQDIVMGCFVGFLSISFLTASVVIIGK